LKAGIETDAASSLSSEYQRRLARNVAILKETWFQSRVDGYFLLPPTERFDYLDQQVETVMIWSTVDVACDAVDTSLTAEQQRHEFSMLFFADVERWIAEAEASCAERMTRAVRDGLTCWLATRDLSEEPMATRQTLAERIVDDLNSGLHLDRLIQDLAPQQKARLSANSHLLLEAWLHRESETFAALPSDQRAAYVDVRIDEFSHWGFLESMAGDVEESLPEGSGLTQLLLEVETWIQRAPPEKQADLRALVHAIQQRFLWQSLQGLWRR
jgi:hypothetical protein